MSRELSKITQCLVIIIAGKLVATRNSRLFCLLYKSNIAIRLEVARKV